LPQEALWLEVYTGLGLSVEDVMSGFFSGPAFLPWNRMGNIERSWDAPLSLTWVHAQEVMQLQILTRMRSFGMQPVLPGFAGHVPAALATLFPNSSFARSPSWRGFEASYSEDALLSPSDPLFQVIGRKFYALLSSRWWNRTANATAARDAVPRYFSADVFNEMQPASGDAAYLAQVNADIYQAMSSECPGAVMVMQGWLFLNGQKFWKKDGRVEAFLSGVPDHAMLILDLASDERVVADEYESYFGKPWIWSQLQVFGGRRGMYGSLSDTSSGPPAQRALRNSSMVGIGATPEALEINPVSWDLLWEMGWRHDSLSQDQLQNWVARYASRRYGLAQPAPLVQRAWRVLHETQYTASVGNYATSMLCWLETEPGLSYARIEGDRIGLPDGIPQALRLLLAAASAGEVDPSTPSFLYDVIDLCRQLCCNVHSDLAVLAGWEFARFGQELAMSASSESTAPAAVNATQTALTDIIRDLDVLLATHESFMIGPRMNEAVAWAQGNASAEEAMRYQFLNQVTIWGPTHKLSVSSGHNDCALQQPITSLSELSWLMCIIRCADCL
jgi:alpha-N-acetylglucosaminidase